MIWGSMEIRAVTIHCQPEFALEESASFLAAARGAFQFRLQTVRLATTPFPEWISSPEISSHALGVLAARWRQTGAEHISFGPVLLRHDREWIGLVPRLAEAGLFSAIEIADRDGHIDLDRVTDTARAIVVTSKLLPDGFGNLFFGALANCGPGHPFLPTAYHGGGRPSFAIAVEAADLAVESFLTSTSLTEARERLVSAIESAAISLQDSATELAEKSSVDFAGIDFSLAQYPADGRSLGQAIEALGLAWIGGHGSTFAAAFVADAIGRANFKKVGFNGNMLPVLEDTVLSRRVIEGRLSISNLLNYAAVCGVGLDTIPLPGDISISSLRGMLLDIAALATRLDKPLIARLMPIPGLVAGDQVSSDFEYFADSAVMAADDEGPDGLMNTNERIALRPIPRGGPAR